MPHGLTRCSLVPIRMTPTQPVISHVAVARGPAQARVEGLLRRDGAEETLTTQETEPHK